MRYDCDEVSGFVFLELEQMMILLESLYSAGMDPQKNRRFISYRVNLCELHESYKYEFMVGLKDFCNHKGYSVRFIQEVLYPALTKNIV